ncbi:MAG: right-handed parallel beta-helix repeat-containing protein [Prosthecobacter sp.]|uniref:right-handed parallel beta-helix repeat-containing protein n=1 Tax=Prosthecobacter sp. TaxID=1965333 RepID=UPI0038FE1B0B
MTPPLHCTAFAALLLFAIAPLGAAEPPNAVTEKTPRTEIIAQIMKDFSLTPEQVEQEPWRKIIDHDNWYHRSRVMAWPAMDASATKTVTATGVDDDIAIQKAIDALPASGGKVVLQPGTFVLGNALRPKSRTEIEIHGTLKVADAVRSTLTADVVSGDTSVTVADASRFRVGQWVTVCDDSEKNVHRQPRHYGETTTIKAIRGNTLDLGTKLGVRYAKSRKELTGYTVARNAFVTTSHSAIVVEGVERVFIHGGAGRGEIDGNRTHQSATAPLATDDDVEDLRANCGISVVSSSWVKVENLLLRDANLHNIAIYKTKHCEAAGLETTGCNDKNICAMRVETLRLFGNHCHDSVKEDGICVHGPGGPHILIANNRTVNNPRFGIHIGVASPHMLVARNVMQSNPKDLLLLDGDFQLRINGKGKQPPQPAEAELIQHKMIVIENTAGGAQR